MSLPAPSVCVFSSLRPALQGKQFIPDRVYWSVDQIT